MQSMAPQSFSDSGTAQQFMNPYLQSSLQPQMDEARRQNMIQQQQQNSGLSKAGAFGGSRQAVMNSQMDDSLLRNMANITGQGYNQAFNQAQNQFNTEQGRNLGQFNTEQDRGIRQFNTEQDRALNQSNFQQGRNLGQFNTEQDRGLRQFNTQQDRALGQFNTEQGLGLQAAGRNQGYGLDVLRAQAQGGDTQRNIENQGIAADLAQFQEERDDPRRQVQFMQSLLQGLPIASQNINYAQPSALNQGIGSIAGIGDLFQSIFGLGG